MLLVSDFLFNSIRMMHVSALLLLFVLFVKCSNMGGPPAVFCLVELLKLSSQLIVATPEPFIPLAVISYALL